MTTLKQHEKYFENNPKKVIKKVIFWIIGLFILFSSIFYGLGWFSEAAVVAKQEFGAKESLRKYEWFKDASETIGEKRKTIAIYEKNITNLKEDYKDIPRNNWDRIDKQQYNQWTMEITGIKASYNKVVKEYNAQSSKFNWEIYNTYELPKSFDLYLDN